MIIIQMRFRRDELRRHLCGRSHQKPSAHKICTFAHRAAIPRWDSRGQVPHDRPADQPIVCKTNNRARAVSRCREIAHSSRPSSSVAWERWPATCRKRSCDHSELGRIVESEFNAINTRVHTNAQRYVRTSHRLATDHRVRFVCFRSAHQIGARRPHM